jgi:hypothetical protein
MVQAPSMNGTARRSVHGFTSKSSPSGEDTPDSVSSTPQYPSHAIAIVGMAGRFPGADSLEELWEVISEGKVRFFTNSECGMD